MSIICMVYTTNITRLGQGYFKKKVFFNVYKHFFTFINPFRYVFFNIIFIVYYICDLIWELNNLRDLTNNKSKGHS